MQPSHEHILSDPSLLPISYLRLLPNESSSCQVLLTPECSGNNLVSVMQHKWKDKDM